MELLKPEQIQEFKQVFEIFDKDGDGDISSSELTEVIKAMGMDETSVQELVKHVDIDGDGVVSFEEFCLLLVKRMAVDEEDLAKELARKAFEKMDDDKDGYLSVQELGRTMKFLGERLRKNELEEMLAFADADSDGLVSLNDFINIMQRISIHSYN